MLNSVTLFFNLLNKYEAAKHAGTFKLGQISQ